MPAVTTSATRSARVLCAVILTVMLGGCRSEPSSSEIDRWRSEAQQANAAAKKRAATTLKRAPWTLTVAGRTRDGASNELDWEAVQKLATTSIRTRSPQNPGAPDATVHFRGVNVADLLERYGHGSGVEEITFLAHDAFRSTIRLADAKRFPIVLAVEANGQPIPRPRGGPIFLTFPHDQHPITRKLYPDRYWCFYVTHMIVGTPPIAIKVGDKVLDGPALAALPQVTIEQPVRYKVHWPSGAVKLHGVTLRDVFRSAGVKLNAGDSVVAVGKAPIHRDAADPMRFSVEDVRSCNIMLGTHWGDERKPISARLGGPVTIALPAACAGRYSDKRWVIMLEELRVERGGGGS